MELCEVNFWFGVVYRLRLEEKEGIIVGGGGSCVIIMGNVGGECGN